MAEARCAALRLSLGGYALGVFRVPPGWTR